MAEFAYNNVKNISTGYTPFEFNCGFNPRVSYKKDVDPCSRSKTVEQLVTELQTLMSVCRENVYYTQELQKCYYNKHAKPRSSALRDKVWLNSKYIKTKRNCKLKFKYFRSFKVLHPVEKQVYKLELSRRWRIHNVFLMFLLEQDTIKNSASRQKDFAV